MDKSRSGFGRIILLIAILIVLGSGVFYYRYIHQNSQLSDTCSYKEASIGETTVGELGGVSNIWERDYIDQNGKKTKGIVAQLSFRSGGRVQVYKGYKLELDGLKYEITNVVEDPNARGHIVYKQLCGK